MPDVITYNSCISACEKGGPAACEKALDLLREMEDNSITPTVITYSAVRTLHPT